MVLGKNRIKYLSSLKIKKYRIQYRQFMVEGDKIVRELLHEGKPAIRQLIATPEWLSTSGTGLADRAGEILEASPRDFQRISSLETPPGVLAVLDIPDIAPDYNELSVSLSIALDTIQDPGNLGTIIRTADWFGIRHIVCNEGCADCFSPKVVQASMGALFRVKVYYTDLPELLQSLPESPDYIIYGTFTEGIPVYDIPVTRKGMFVFGNESRGISTGLLPFISTRISIPPGTHAVTHVESLNVASAVAVICSVIAPR